MPLGGSDINWDEAKPADTDSAGLGDDEFRSLKTALRNALDSEHNWPSSGGAGTGYHRFGSARVFVAAQSLVSSSGTDGRLMITSDTSNLFGVGSGGTSFFGGARVISAGSFPGVVPQRAFWVTEFGEGRVTSSAGTTISFPNSGFNGKPFVQITAIQETAAAVMAQLETVTATSINVLMFDMAGVATSNVSFFWSSIGTRNF